MRPVNEAGLNLVKSFEGLHRLGTDGLVYPYRDPIGLPTIGYGELLSRDPTADLSQWEPITVEQAEQLLLKRLPQYAMSVLRLISVPLTDNQFAALTSFVYNLGGGALQASTLRRLLNGGDIMGAADQFLRWNKAGGRVYKGLTRRREAERSLFLEGWICE